MTTKRMGEEGLRWFVGTVEDINDPQKLGRVKVRVVNEHDDPSITKDQLLWATPINSVTSAGYQGIGRSPTGLLVGSHVFGFYMDGNEKQLPLLWGTYAKLPDGTQGSNEVPALAREINNIKITRVGPEPAQAYAAKYPYNHVTQTQSGHFVEFDDTPSNERIRIFHKSGTYTEINKDGRMVVKSVNDSFEIVVGNKNLYVGGDCNITVVGTCNLKAQDVNITSAAGVGINAPAGLNVTKGNIMVAESVIVGSAASGTFTSPSGQTIHVQSGIVTNID
jgi:Gp5 N-terminal OB domain